MTEPAPRPTSSDPRLLAGAGLAVLASIVLVSLAWSRSVWLGVPILIGLVAAPFVRAIIGPRLIGARDLPETEEPELYRLVRQMCQVRERIAEPRILLTNTDAPVAVAAGWPLRSRLVVSTGMLSDLGHDAQMAMITRELSRMRQPYAVVDAFAWVLAPLGLVALIARLPSLGGIVLGVLGLAIALAALVIVIHARETIADDEALERTGQRFAVEEAIRSIDRHPPRGRGWLLASALLLVPPPRFVREFIPPTADDRVARLASADQIDTDELMGTGPAPLEGMGALVSGRPDSTARMVLLGVLAVAGAIVVLALTAGGGGGDDRSAASGQQGRGQDTGTTTGGARTSTTEESLCPSSFNGNADSPVIIDAGVTPDLYELRWWVRWCDDTDRGTTFVILRLAGQERHMIRREIRSRSKPGTNSFSVFPADLGWAPGRYRWRLVVRDINANTDERRSTGTIFVPGIP